MNKIKYHKQISEKSNCDELVKCFEENNSNKTEKEVWVKWKNWTLLKKLRTDGIQQNEHNGPTKKERCLAFLIDSNRPN